MTGLQALERNAPSRPMTYGHCEKIEFEYTRHGTLTLIGNFWRSRMPMITLSDAALALLRLHVEWRGQIDADDSNREAYRELARTGLMIVGHSFTGGRESLYRLTKEGYDFVNAPSHGISAARPR